MFKSLNKINEGNSLYHQVVENIRTLVLEGKLKPGEKLPSERELAEMYGVSRVPVREAIENARVFRDFEKCSRRRRVYSEAAGRRFAGQCCLCRARR